MTIVVAPDHAKFEELGMEAIYEFEVVDMPVTVAANSTGDSVHQKGPAEWLVKIADLKLNGKSPDWPPLPPGEGRGEGKFVKG